MNCLDLGSIKWRPLTAVWLADENFIISCYAVIEIVFTYNSCRQTKLYKMRLAARASTAR